ncbi:MAG: hypothetical protein NC131_00235 [Roseburia sp.]|nr:hypothetical protein [Roseburia sp.]
MMKSKFRKIAVAALAAAGLTALSVGVAGCLPKSTDLTEPDNVEVARLAPPDDGSLPTAHTCAENLAYINYVFDHQTQYHTYSYGVTSASIATQTTRNFRDFKDGILLNTDLTYSSMVKSGTQTCSMYNDEGEYEVYFRTSGAPEADTLPAQASWSEEAPTFFDEHAYHYTYGLLPNELFNYIVNEQNIIDSEQIKVNSDGTYTQSFTLDPVASTYFYQFGMKTRGGLSGYPDFESITFSVTFDGDWQILSSVMHEVAKVNKGIIVSSVSDFTTQYWYGSDHFDEEHFAYYESYYKNYVGDGEQLEQGGSTDEKLIIDVTNVLSNGFSQIMNGGAQFEINVNLGANRYTGYAFISLDLADPLGTLALKVSLGKTLKEQTLYIEYGGEGLAAYYGKDFALSGNLAELKLAVDGFGDVIDKIKSALTAPETAPAENGGAQALPEAQAEGGDPLSELMNAMVLTAGEKQATLTLDTDDLLGLGVGINAKLIFGINSNKITFRSGSIGGLSIGGEEVDLGVTILTTTVPEIKREPSETAADLAEYIADVHSLIGSDLIKVTANLDGDGEKVSIGALKGLNADVAAYVDLGGITVGAQADVSYTFKGQKISAKAEVWYGYDAAKENYGSAIVSLSEFNGNPVNLKIKCDVKAVAEAVSTLVTFAGGDGGEAANGLVGMINGALSSDFSSLLTEMYADKAQIKVGLSVDSLLEMLGVDAGVKFGSCTLKYQRGEGVYGGELSAALPALGLSLAISGEGGAISMPDTENCLDLMYVIDDVKAIAAADLLKAHLSLDGSAEGVTVSQLSGVTGGIDVYLNLENIAVAADIDLSYTYGGDKVSANLSAWYAKGEEGLGEIVLSLNAINGAPLAAKVYCDVSEIKDAVTALLNYADIKVSPFEGNEGGVNIDEIITKILGADFKELLPVLGTTDDGLNVSMNVDGVLSLFGVNANISLGNVALAYSHGAENKLTATVPALGLGIDICGETGSLKRTPDKADCLNLTDLVKTVQAVWEQVDGIIGNQSISFTVARGETYLSLDGIIVEIWGEGEVCWKNGSEYVALDLSMSITERATDVLDFKFIYDKNAVNAPLVKLALNEVGIEIYNDDIETVKNGFNDIYNKVKDVLGGGEQETLPENGNVESGVKQKFALTDNLLGVLFGMLSSDGWVDALNNVTVTCNGKSVMLSYLTDNCVEVGVNAGGELSLFYDGAIGDRFSLSGGLTATATVGNLCDSINSKLENCKMSSSEKEGSAGFVKLAYDYLFEAISAIDVSHILGADTYTVTFKLSGDNTNIPELEDIFIDAGIYVTGAKGGQGKLAEADLNINAAGVVIILNVITERVNGDTCFYINLKQVMDIKLPDLKFKATQSSLYDTIDVLISTVNNTNVLEFIGGFIGGEKDVTAAETTTDGAAEKDADGAGEPATEKPLADKLADIITKLLNFNFNQAVAATETDGVMTATIDLDNIVKQLGVKSGTLGTVEAVINHNNHSMKTSGKTLKTDVNGVTELKEWISLSSELAARRDYSKLDKSEYISIEFLPTLLDDLVKTATDSNGNVHTAFTLNGSITANIVNIIDVNIDNCTVTLGVDKNKGITVSLAAHIKKVSALGIVTIPESTFGLTYRNGLLTLARGLDTSAPEYKIMTFDYFIDHMLTKSDSALQWLLNVSGWNTLIGVVDMAAGDLNVSSGLTSPEDVYLYKANTVKEEQEISMYAFVNALRVIIGGNETAVFGDYNALENDLKVYDNYYGFALNAGAVTNGVLTKLNAAITRTDAGLDRILASGAIQSYVTFAANLQFNENCTGEYVSGSALTSGLTAPDMYETALAKAQANGYKPDFDHFVKKPTEGYDEKFGCLTVSGENYSVDYSHVLYSHTLTVVKANGEKETRLVRHGSTIHLYDNASPLYENEKKTVRILYSVTDGEVGAASVIMNGDLTVYAVKREAVTVVIHSGSEEYEIASFVGDKVPASVAGLETVSAPTYADGTPVGENDIIEAGSGTVHVYGTFVQSEIVVNYVKYTFSYDIETGHGRYTASGKAAGFNDYYSAKGNTLVLENGIGGYNVEAIAPEAFANTDGNPIKSVVVPENIVTVGAGAFLDNVGMESAVFLAEKVVMGGAADKDNNSDKDQPFYGCSTTADGTSTNLVIYYNMAEAGGSTTNTIWTKFRVSGGAIKNRYYVGQKPSNENGYAKNGGGALYSKGHWQYVGYKVNIDLNGVKSSKLTEQAVSDVLAAYLPAAMTTAYAGSATEAKVNEALENALGSFAVVENGINYTCLLTTDITTDGSKVTVTFNVAYTASATISVYSPYAVTCYGVDVPANAYTDVSVPLSDGEIVMPTNLTEKTHVFVEWQSELKDNKLVYTAVWRDKNRYTLTYKISGNFSMKVSDTFKNVSGKTTTSYSANFEVLEGQVVKAVKTEGKKIIIYVDGEEKTTLTLAKNILSNYDFKDVSYDVTINSNQTFTFNW